MAALRAHGVTGTTSARTSGPRPMAAPPAVYKPPPASITSSGGSASQASQYLSQSPTTTSARGDLVEDSAIQRSGSAPAVIPLTDEDGSHGFMSHGSTLVAQTSNGQIETTRRSVDSRYDEVASLPSPTDFRTNFPSLDDFERTVPVERSEEVQLPSVPTAKPSATASQSAGDHRSLPPPPRPFEMDAREFDRQQRIHSEAMTSLGGQPKPANGPPPPRKDLPSSLIPGQSSRTSQSISTVRPSQAPSPRPRLPPPTASSSKNFDLPPTAEIAPVQFYNYLSSSQARKGDGPRVLLLDLRSREEFERGRIMGETLCLEPVVLRPG